MTVTKVTENTQETSALTRLAARAVGATSLLAAVAYAVTILGYEVFYNNFNMRPQDVGIDYATVLVRAAVGLVVIALFYGAVFLIGVNVWPLWRARHPSSVPVEIRTADQPVRPIPNGDVPAWPSIFAPGPTTSDFEWLYATSVPAAWSTWFAIEMLVVPGGNNALVWVLATSAWALWMFAAWRFHAARRANDVSHRIAILHFRVALLAAALFGVSALLLCSDTLARSVASYVEHTGQLPSGIGNSSLSSIYVQANCVTVHPTAAPIPGVTLAGHFVDLGTSSGTTFLFDPAHNRVVRLQSSLVVLTDDFDPTACRP
jgi:hypothetical protein